MQTVMSRALVAKPTLGASRLMARRNAGVRHSAPGRSVVTQAAKDFDFDALLMDAANKFEKADNKPAIIGWGVGAAAAIITAEWLIHLPLFNVLLGFPIQLFGLLLLPYLGIKYFVEGDDYTADAGAVVKTITDQLPGLGKK